MTEREAIEIIKYASAFNSDNSPLTIALGIAITALEEIQQYRATGLTPQMIMDLIKSEKNAHKSALENAKLVDEYKDLEEQGLLLRLPCKVGDTIYKIPSQVNFDLSILNGMSELNKVYAQKIHSIQMWDNERYILKTCNGENCASSGFYKKTWFLTKEEAEAVLEKMKGDLNKYIDKILEDGE